MTLNHSVSLDSPLGRLRLHATATHLTRLDLPGTRPAPTAGGAAEAGPAGVLLRRAAVELGEYFAGRRTVFDLPLSPAGTAFQRRVWDLLRRIPHGQTRTYGQLASQLNQPGASRAVGLANAKNPLPIVLPCHRVIGADGRLTGFAGGLPAKAWLLKLEAPPTPLFAHL